jgi:hypothetical protein
MANAERHPELDLTGHWLQEEGAVSRHFEELLSSSAATDPRRTYAQAGPSTGQNTSTDQHRRASIRLSRAHFATQSALRFDLVLMAAGVFVEQVEGLVVAEVKRG